MTENNKDLESFLKRNEGDRFASQRSAYKKIMAKYPSLQIYGFRSAIKHYFVKNGASHFDMYAGCVCCSWCDEYIGECEVCYGEGDKCESKHLFSQGNLKPNFTPDMFCITEDVIIMVEVENYHRFEQKFDRFYRWYSEVDAMQALNLFIIGFNRFGNFERVIFPCDTDDEIERIINTYSTGVSAEQKKIDIEELKEKSYVQYLEGIENLKDLENSYI